MESKKTRFWKQIIVTVFLWNIIILWLGGWLDTYELFGVERTWGYFFLYGAKEAATFFLMTFIPSTFIFWLPLHSIFLDVQNKKFPLKGPVIFTGACLLIGMIVIVADLVMPMNNRLLSSGDGGALLTIAVTVIFPQVAIPIWITAFIAHWSGKRIRKNS